MSCVHLKKLYALCADEGMKISSSDLIHFVCTQCGEQEVCPSMLLDQYEALHPEEAVETPGEQDETPQRDG